MNISVDGAMLFQRMKDIAELGRDRYDIEEWGAFVEGWQAQ